MRSDRRALGAYDEARQEWDAVFEVNWQPRMVRGALTALRDGSRWWAYVSSGSAYASHAAVGADESAELLPPTDREDVDMDLYGEAKVACELATRAAVGKEALIARSGLIGGPGDGSDRAGYWVARAARDPTGTMLVPDTPEAPAQVIDVRDLAAWLVDCAEQKISGTYDAVGAMTTLDEWIETSRRVAGHTGPVVRASSEWLLAHDVAEFMGEGALPLWIADPAWLGFCARSGRKALAAGLRHRPARHTINDLLSWERTLGLDRARKAGITSAREAELLATLAAE